MFGPFTLTFAIWALILLENAWLSFILDQLNFEIKLKFQIKLCLWFFIKLNSNLIGQRNCEIDILEFFIFNFLDMFELVWLIMFFDSVDLGFGSNKAQFV